MVGVPGKSKGCATCRRRKIRCDFGKPNCQRCIKSGRSCEGYDRYPTFLNSSATGREKRHGLEEVKSRNPLLDDASPGASAPASANVSNAGGNKDREESWALVCRESPPTLFRQTSNVEVQDVQVVSQFWEKFVPTATQAQDETPCAWLQEAIVFEGGGKPLQNSLKALSMTRLGFLSGDTALTIRGRNFYGHALRQLQNALWDEELMWNDDTFASAYILSVYELFETTTGGIKGWNSHISGLGNLVRLRGPRRYRTPLARAVLESFYFSAMVQSVQFRKGSFLCDPEWRTIPWLHTSKDIFTQLHEHGLTIGATLDAADREGLQRGSLSQEATFRYAHRFTYINTTLDTWFASLKSQLPGPLYTTSTPFPQASPPALKPFTFPTLRLATITCTYWTLKIVVSTTISQICSTPPTPPLQSSAKAELDALASPHGKATWLAIAANIMCTMPYCLNDNQGLLGAQQSLCASRSALYILRLFPEEGLEPLWAMYQSIDSIKGVGYAREIAKMDGGYGHGRARVLQRGTSPGNAGDVPYRVQSPDPCGRREEGIGSERGGRG